MAQTGSQTRFRVSSLGGVTITDIVQEMPLLTRYYFRSQVFRSSLQGKQRTPYVTSCLSVI
jgi:hypothetical protein